MAHNLNYSERSGQYSFFSVREKAWHGLGQVVQDYPTSAEAIRFAGLDYRVEKRKLFTPEGNPSPFEEERGRSASIEVPDYFATVRTDTDTVLGVVGKEYRVVQNVDAFSFFDAIVVGDGILYETAGALGRGERIFITAKLPGYIRVGREDLIEQYLFLTTSHDGLGSITAAFTPIRIVCNNTLSAALKNCSSGVKIRHTQSAKERLAQAHKVMGITNQLSAQLEAIFNRWTKVPVTDRQVKDLTQLAMAPSREVLQQIKSGREEELSTCFKNTCEAVHAYALSSPTQQTETTRGTLFGAYNAVTGYFQNVRSYRDGEAKLKSLLLGGTAQVKTQRAFDLCAEFAAKGASAWGLN